MMRTKIITLDEVDSTNRYLHDYHEAPDEDMVVVTARHQTAGRGQGGNRWHDRAGDSLLFSLLIRPMTVSVASQYVLSMAEALAVKEALDGYADGFALKWPNDVYWHDCKISGTLIETAVGREGLRRMIFGTGININQHSFAIDAPNPVSLYQILGHEVPVEEVLRRILTVFGHYYEVVLSGDYERVSRLYHAALYRREGYHAYRDGEGCFEACLDHVEPDGRLVLRDRHGRVRTYGFKEVAYII